MERKPVTSSNLRSVGYNETNKILEIEFHKGGIYQYLEVPKEIYEELMKAPSQGRYHYYRIKNRFRYKKINIR